MLVVATEAPTHIERAVAAVPGEMLEVVGVVEGQKMIGSLAATLAGWAVAPVVNSTLVQVSLPSRRAMEGQAEVSLVAVAAALLVSAAAQPRAVLLRIYRQESRESLAESISVSSFSHCPAILHSTAQHVHPKTAATPRGTGGRLGLAGPRAAQAVSPWTRSA